MLNWYMETNPGMLALSVWVCGFAVTILGYGVREHCLSRGHGDVENGCYTSFILKNNLNTHKKYQLKLLKSF